MKMECISEKRNFGKTIRLLEEKSNRAISFSFKTTSTKNMMSFFSKLNKLPSKTKVYLDAEILEEREDKILVVVDDDNLKIGLEEGKRNGRKKF